jgi:hypothetical protein
MFFHLARGTCRQARVIRSDARLHERKYGQLQSVKYACKQPSLGFGRSFLKISSFYLDRMNPFAPESFLNYSSSALLRF